LNGDFVRYVQIEAQKQRSPKGERCSRHSSVMMTIASAVVAMTMLCAMR